MTLRCHNDLPTREAGWKSLQLVLHVSYVACCSSSEQAALVLNSLARGGSLASGHWQNAVRTTCSW